jgi:hypothetical protein
MAFNGLNRTIPKGTSQDWIVVYDFNGSDPGGNTFGADFPGTGSVSGTGMTSSSPAIVTTSAFAGRLVTTMVIGSLTAFAGSGNPVAANIAGTETGHLMLHTTLTAGSVEAVTITEVRFTNTGTGNTNGDVSNVYLVRDDNANGVYDSGTDTTLGTVTLPPPTQDLFIFPISQTVAASGTLGLLVLYDFKGTTPPGDDFQASLAQGSHVVATGDTTSQPVTPAGTPVLGGRQTVAPGTLSVAAGPNMPAGLPVTPPVIQSVLQISLTAGPSEGVNVSNITFTDNGGGAPANIQWAHLYDDVGPTPGQFDPGQDQSLQSNQTFSGSTVAFNITGNIAAGQTVNWILIYDWGGGTGGSYRATVNPSAQITATGAISSATIVPTGASVQGNVFTISGGPSTMNWAQLSPTGSGPGALIYHSGVYDTGNQRAIFFGGTNSTTIIGGAQSSTYFLTTGSVGSETWQPFTPGGTPPTARFGHSAAFDASGQRMLIYGGLDNTSSTLSDVHAMTTATQGSESWSQITPTGGAPGRANAAVAYDPGTNALIVVCGADGGGTDYGDTYELDLNTNQWTQRSTAGPTVRSGCVGAVHSGVMMVFGGFTVGTATYHADTWILNLSNWTWSQLTPSTVPPARAEATLAYDPVNGRAYMYGGADASGARNDVYYYDFVIQNWFLISPGGTPPNARQAAGAGWDTSNLRMVIQGGGVAGLPATLYSDTFELR